MPYMDIVMPPLLEAAQLKPDVNISDIASDAGDDGDDDDDDEVPLLSPPLFNLCDWPHIIASSPGLSCNGRMANL